VPNYRRPEAASASGDDGRLAVKIHLLPSLPWTIRPAQMKVTGFDYDVNI
jgi:hypothetical protein